MGGGNCPDGVTVSFLSRKYCIGAQVNISSNGVLTYGTGGVRGTQLVNTAALGDCVRATNADRTWFDGISFTSTVTKAAGTAAVRFANCHDCGIGYNFRIYYHHYAIAVEADGNQYICNILGDDIGELTGDAVVLGENGRLVQGVFLTNTQIHYCDGFGIAQYSTSDVQSLNVNIGGCKSAFFTYPDGLVKTGSTNSNDIIDDLDTTFDLNVDMVVVGNDGTLANVVEIVSSTSVRVSPEPTATASGVNFYFYNVVVAGRHVGLVLDTSDEDGGKFFTNGGMLVDQKLYNPRACANGHSDRGNPNFAGIKSKNGGPNNATKARSLIQDIQLDTPTCQNNPGSGISVEEVSPGTVKHWGVNNPSIGQNSAAGSALKSGIDVGAGVSHWNVRGGHSGDARIVIGVLNLQACGIKVASGSSDYYNITEMDVTGNVSGGVADDGTGTHQNPFGNLGENENYFSRGVTLLKDTDSLLKICRYNASFPYSVIHIDNSDAFVLQEGGGVEFAQISKNGVVTLKAGGSVKIGSTQIAGVRATGWGAPTRTATKTTFDTATVTTTQLAERVKALIDNLATHGLIGI